MQRVKVELPASKSISNRLLIINALSGNTIEISNLSEANDTVVLQRVLSDINTSQPPSEINCEDAGTVMRFLTAFFSIQQGKWLLKGTERMHQRPIAILVDKLKELGADIEYKEKEGYPPLLITGKKLNGGKLSVDATISSQYISALMLVAPYLQHGLQIELKGNVASQPYIEMTAALMLKSGVEVGFKKNTISVPQAGYRSGKIEVENDWSAASYWYALAAISNYGIKLHGLQHNSTQGDSIVVKLMEEFGVKTTYNSSGVLLTKATERTKYFEYNFSQCPDLAPTFVCLCAAMGIPAKFSGMESLAIKESDRTAALATELNKLGVVFIQKQKYWELVPGKNTLNLLEPVALDTYGDHRLAMAFSVFKLQHFSKVTINNTEVVKKSYPTFWQEFEKLVLE